MGKIKKSFKQYFDENDGFRKPRRVEKKSRHNEKQTLKQAVESKDLEEIDDEYYGKRDRIYHR